MNGIKETIFRVFIDGIQIGNAGTWDHTPLMVASRWEAGGDEEKYEVLAAIRRTYNPDNKNNIRGNEQQTPAQIGRAEGFKKLSYNRNFSTALPVVIVSAFDVSHRVKPQQE